MTDTVFFPVSMDTLSSVRSHVEAQAARLPLAHEREALLTVAVIEVVTNIVRHVTGLTTGMQIQLDSLLERNSQQSSLTLTISYPGPPYTPPLPKQEIDYAHLPEGGFGNFIIHNSCDKVVFDHAGGRNSIAMSVYLPVLTK